MDPGVHRGYGCMVEGRWRCAGGRCGLRGKIFTATLECVLRWIQGASVVTGKSPLTAPRFTRLTHMTKLAKRRSRTVKPTLHYTQKGQGKLRSGSVTCKSMRTRWNTAIQSRLPMALWALLRSGWAFMLLKQSSERGRKMHY
ncbi:hypothetical protein [Klebsiella phage vB_KshKPC-M]|nr:hypothetical protein [Klebsiella phage vB_KshKPC-M]